MIDEDGTLVLATPSAEGLTIHSEVELLSNTSRTVPTLVGKTLYMRDRKTMMALGPELNAKIVNPQFHWNLHRPAVSEPSDSAATYTPSRDTNLLSRIWDGQRTSLFNRGELHTLQRRFFSRA